MDEARCQESGGSAPETPPSTLGWRITNREVDVSAFTDRDDQLWPAGRHVPQTLGTPSIGLPEWIGDGTEPITDTDIVLWHTFGVTHIPAPEDFPVMPREPITLLLRPRNFFRSNPVMDVPPSWASVPSQVAREGVERGVVEAADRMSRLAFGNGVADDDGATCCANGNGVNGSH